MNGRSLIRLLLPTLTVALAAAACTKDLSHPGLDPESPAASEAPIEFAVGEGTKGQAPITTLAELAKRDFSVSATYVAPGKAFRDGDATRIAYIANHRFGYLTNDPDHDAFSDAWRGVAAHAATTGAAAAAPVYWPLDGSLTFFCFAPYRADAALDTPPVPDTRDIVLEAPVTDAGVIARLPGYLPGSPLLRVTPAASAADQVDFLAAPAVLDKRRTDNAGRFPLDLSQHRMTQVEFWFNYKGTLTNDPGVLVENIRVTGITIKNVVGSRYLYYQDASPWNCVWSDQVCPTDPADGTAVWPASWPTASYQLRASYGELKVYPSGGLPHKDDGSAPENPERITTDAGLLYVLPQTLPAGAVLEVSYSIVEQHGVARASEVVSCSLAGTTAWPEGKRVRYKLTLDIPSRGIVGLSAVEITDWADAGNTNHPGVDPPEILY